MLAKLARSAIDLGIIIRNADACLSFYRDFLGLELEGELDLPGVHMHLFLCGDSVIKLLTLKQAPEAANPPGGIPTATGMRYWTVQVENLDEINAKCVKSGRPIPMPLNEIRPGVRMLMVEDPDGNWLEFVERK